MITYSVPVDAMLQIIKYIFLFFSLAMYYIVLWLRLYNYILITKVNLGEWQPKIHVIDFNKVCEIKTSKIKEIPVKEKVRLKSCHKHIDPALYDGQYALAQHQMFIINRN